MNMLFKRFPKNKAELIEEISRAHIRVVSYNTVEDKGDVRLFTRFLNQHIEDGEEQFIVCLFGSTKGPKR